MLSVIRVGFFFFHLTPSELWTLKNISQAAFIMKSNTETQITLKFSQTLTVLQAGERGCFYEMGKMVLQYEQEQTGTSLQHSSLQVFYHPLGESESSQTSEGSGETGDSGNFSQDEAEPEPNIPDNREKKRNSSENLGDASTFVLKICPHISLWITSCLSEAQYTASDASETGLHILHLRICCLSGNGGELFTCQRPESFPIIQQK